MPGYFPYATSDYKPELLTDRIRLISEELLKSEEDLVKENIIVEYQTDWSKSVDGSYALSDRPYIGSGNYNGVEGWYFKRNSNKNLFLNSKLSCKILALLTSSSTPISL